MKYALVLIFSVWWTLVQGQIADVEVFEGTIHYDISSGRVQAQSTNLPETLLVERMEMDYSPEGIHCRMYGGIVDSLITEWIWLADSQMVYILDDYNQIAYAQPAIYDYSQEPAAQAIEGGYPTGDSLLGYPLAWFRLGNTNIAVPKGLAYPVPQMEDVNGSRPEFLRLPVLAPMFVLYSRSEMDIYISTAKKLEARDLPPLTFPDGYSVEPFFSAKIRHPYFKDGKE